MPKRYLILLGVLLPVFVGFLIPEPRLIPVAGATSKDWNAETFWYEPWGKSGVHKGIDIFAGKGTNVIATTNMLVLYQGSISRGGNVVVALGPKWRIHYFAHLDAISAKAGRLAARGQVLGQVGDTGNAAGTPPHLHYSIVSLIPMPWRLDFSTQGYKKMFYLNPIEYLADTRSN